MSAGYEVRLHDWRGRILEVLTADDGIDALDLASDFDRWTPAVAWMTIVHAGEVVQKFPSHYEAYGAYLLATGRVPERSDV